MIRSVSTLPRVSPSIRRMLTSTVTVALAGMGPSPNVTRAQVAPSDVLPCGGFRELTPQETEELSRAATCTQGWNAETINNHGPSSNRYDLVFVGDGFVNDPTLMNDNLSWYANAVDVHRDELLATHPFNVYQNYINIHRVDVISHDSCIDTGTMTCDTALDFAYVLGDPPILTFPLAKMADAASCAPDYQAVLGLANLSRHAGTAYGSFAAVSAKSIYGPSFITVHELGHSIGRLADEYVLYAGAFPYPEPVQRNISTYDWIEQIENNVKWYRWMHTAGVLTYEGAGYWQLGIYRSLQNSIMRSHHSCDPLEPGSCHFGPVNAEGIILEIYRKVSPIDGQSPPPSATTLYPADTVFHVNLLQPATPTVEVRWFVNGAPAGPPVVGVTQSSFQIPGYGSLPGGLHEVKAQAVDKTTLVRDEPARQSIMTDATTWEVRVGNFCRDNPDCAHDHFCQKPVGQCGATGMCVPRPKECLEYSLLYNPVCGCDGQEYGTVCRASLVGVNLASLDECPCRYNSDCIPDKFCKVQCCVTMSGVCTALPLECPPTVDPVCACNSATYDNECLANAAGLSVFGSVLGCGVEDPCGGPPLGACCFSEVTCRYLSEVKCGLMPGGLYLGDMTLCDDCPEPVLGFQEPGESTESPK